MVLIFILFFFNTSVNDLFYASFLTKLENSFTNENIKIMNLKNHYHQMKLKFNKNKYNYFPLFVKFPNEDEYCAFKGKHFLNNDNINLNNEMELWTKRRIYPRILKHNNIDTLIVPFFYVDYYLKNNNTSQKIEEMTMITSSNKYSPFIQHLDHILISLKEIEEFEFENDDKKTKVNNLNLKLINDDIVIVPNIDKNYPNEKPIIVKLSEQVHIDA